MYTEQDDVVDFMMRPESYPDRPETVERVDTHGAMIFLAGERAYKLKRSVKLAYLDFSTLEKRRAVCERELELNRATAPEIYLRVLPVTRDEAGRLVLGGDGQAVDWVIEMRRFDGDQLFDRLAESGALDPSLIAKLAVIIESFHANAPARPEAAWPDSLAQVLRTVTDALGHDALSDQGAERTIARLREEMSAQTDLLNARRKAGFVRRCHGDMHLKNIVLLDGEPRLFDALEFDEDLATIDVLYDLGFLLMDLWHRDLAGEANLIFNHYMPDDGTDIEWAGLSLLPLFTALRAGVRAMVGIDGLGVAQGEKRAQLLDETRSYARLAGELIAPCPPRLIAVGGLSGTGKTTVARVLAPFVQPMPGAIHLRSDVERKRLFGLDTSESLGPDGYTPEVNARVYERIASKAGTILKAGHSVILDATFSRPEDRAALEALAPRLGDGFTGLWLEADTETMIERVSSRHGDASDADAAIVREQLAQKADPPPGWRRINASRSADGIVDEIRAHLQAS